MKSFARMMAVFVPVTILVVLAWRLALSPSPVIVSPLKSLPQPSSKNGHTSLTTGTKCTSSCRYAGIAVASSTSVRTFISATGIKPGIVTIYMSFTSHFPEEWASSMVSNGILPLIQINPRNVSLAAIAAGKYDQSLVNYGEALKKFHHRVALSFAHEMNGHWYPWGCGHVKAQVFVAAWRHIVDVIRQTGATNAMWVWTANVYAKHDCLLVSRYPGNSYVTWVGLDGYLKKPSATFARIFNYSLKQIRSFSDKPILLAEAGALSGAKWPDRILNLYRGAANARGVIGLVYFDSATKKWGDYRPQDNPAALAAFKRGVALLLHSAR